MADKMVLLAIYGNPIEAELARAELEAEGIRAHVLGATSGDLFAGMGVGLSNVQLLVPEPDYERASEMLDAETDVAREARENSEWEEEPSTAIQAAEAANAEATSIRSAGDPHPRSEEDSFTSTEAADEDEKLRDVIPPSPDEDTTREERPLLWTADDISTRAFRAVLFSYVLCPMAYGLYLLFVWPGMVLAVPTFAASVVLYVYSLWLIIRLPFAEGDLTVAGTWKAYIAVALGLFPLLLVVVLAFLRG